MSFLTALLQPSIKRLRPLALMGLCLLTTSGGVYASSWQAGYESALWQASDPSKLNCELTHYIPNFGEARFIHRAGETVRLEVQPFRNALRGGAVKLVALAPQWMPGANTRPLGEYDFQKTDLPIRITTPQTELILESLRQGLMPSMLQEDQDQRIEARRASLTPINFHQAFADFQVCQAQLLPVNYDQIRDVVIGFHLGGAKLTQADRDQLDLLVRYTYADPEVVLVMVDGHSDSSGTRRDNRELSSERADSVTEYLVARGMPQEMIKSQYHGQRYPVASNRTTEGRSKNRRVTIKLERELEIKPIF
ncbi:OmpA family protein [Marinospirillum insulare]|uniref:Membrane protein n=1 Tax=Marinospirillum insulare TaxID=217169 RepID=A0ABQ5ZVV8_9GAMM|nr:OmpA family protein [Marinospirillum insulare]GLR64311.1 membrane protein [Marinospirillum insulare]